MAATSSGQGTSLLVGHDTNGVARAIKVDTDGTLILSVVDWAAHLASTPTIAAGAGAGASPTVAVSGNDAAGVISITTGTTATTSATLATITFGTAYASAPRAVHLTPANAATAALAQAATVYVDLASLTATEFLLKTNGTAPADSTAYKWFFSVVG